VDSAETNSMILEGAGPSDASFNEFTSLFTRDRTIFQVNAIGGSNSTWGDSILASGLQDRFSFSLGQFHYETDGFRPNNDLKQDIYNVFGQVALSGQSNLQLEWKKNEQVTGDLRLRFDPQSFSSNRRDSRDEDTIRFGYNYSPSGHTDWIASVIYRETDLARTDREVLSPDPDLVVKIDNQTIKTEGYNADTQYHTRADKYNYVVGAGYYKDALINDIFQAVIFGSDLFGSPEQNKTYQAHRNLYAYSTWHLNPNFALTLGASVDSYDSNIFNKDQLNPKIGITWNITKVTTVRLAGMRTLKRSLIANQTTEPTQIAGFNQFFDDLPGADAKRYGLGLDHEFGQNLFSGVAFSPRELDVPIARAGETLVLDKQREQLHRAYLYWVPHRKLVFESEYQFERFDRENSITGIGEPSELETHRIPLSINYFLPAGLFFKLHAGYNKQKILLRLPENAFQGDEDRFWLVDTQLGYRLPKRGGVVSIVVKNLLDKTFKFYESNFQSGLEKSPTRQPERTIFVKLTLLFN
jgi:outer membrane receptor for ferrienterochelin and colicin